MADDKTAKMKEALQAAASAVESAMYALEEDEGYDHEGVGVTEEKEVVGPTVGGKKVSAPSEKARMAAAMMTKGMK